MDEGHGIDQGRLRKTRSDLIIISMTLEADDMSLKRGSATDRECLTGRHFSSLQKNRFDMKRRNM
jgi:hypothetical protein